MLESVESALRILVCFYSSVVQLMMIPSRIGNEENPESHLLGSGLLDYLSGSADDAVEGSTGPAAFYPYMSSDFRRPGATASGLGTKTRSADRWSATNTPPHQHSSPDVLSPFQTEKLFNGRSSMFNSDQYGWERVYTPFGPVPNTTRRPEGIITSSASSSPQLVGKSYRDAASKPPLPRGSTSSAGCGMIVSPKEELTAAHLGRKASSGVSSKRQSSSDSSRSSRYGLDVFDDDSLKEFQCPVKNSSACLEDKDVVFIEEKLIDLISKNNLDEKANAFKKSVTTATGFTGSETEGYRFLPVQRRKSSKSDGSDVRKLPTKESNLSHDRNRKVESRSNKQKQSRLPEAVKNTNRVVGEPQEPPPPPPPFESSRFAVLSSSRPGLKVLPKPTLESQLVLNNKTEFRSRSSTRETAYINNDLRSRHPDGSKDESGERETGPRGGAGGVGAGGEGDRGRGARKGRKKLEGVDFSAGLLGRRGLAGDAVLNWIESSVSTCFNWLKFCVLWLVTLVADVAIQLADITAYATKGCYARCCVWAVRAQYLLLDRIQAVRDKFLRLVYRFTRRQMFSAKSSDGLGLEQNIVLPETGEEAMHRLLLCKGQDAYSILGLRGDCTDEDIRRYYRKQAFLVHPDKNQQYGADEAFKILAHAFELIGTQQHRQIYDLENIHRTRAMQEFEAMLGKLKVKMEEALNSMHCDCGKKHRRYRINNRSLSEARYCRRCQETHSVREGDIWCESRLFGFLWYYYACMDGAVYDITEWAGCPKNNLKHMKANVHQIQYRLITGSSNRSQNQPSRTISDADMDDFLRKFCFDDQIGGAGFASDPSGSSPLPPDFQYNPPMAPGTRGKKAPRRRKIRR